MAARELERIMPRQSTRLVLVNDANFMLYTPFLPEAAAGTLEPRHVVTPLREILKRTYLRLGSISAHDPVAKTVELRTREGDVEQLPYDQLLLSLGSVSRVLPVPGLAEHAVGFKSLADAIWLRNHVIETLEAANATEDAARRDELLTYVFVGGGYAGLEALAELQDFAADAIESYPRARLHGMRWVLVEASDRVLPEIDAELADYALRELRGRGIDIRLGTTLEEVTRRLRPDRHRRDAADPDRRLDRRRCPAPEPAPALAAARRARSRPGRRPPAGRGARLGVGDRRLRRGARPARRSLPADRTARRAPGPSRGCATSPPSSGIGNASAVRLQGQRRLRQPRPLQGGRQGRRPHLPRLPGLVDGADLPHEPDPGRGPQDPRGDRLDRQPAVPPRHLRGRLDRTSKAAGGDNRAVGFEYLFIAFSFGLATAIIGKAKGSSFWLWLVIGSVLPLLGLIAVILYRREKDEPERQCPNCHKAVKLYVQVCPRCGADLYLPDPAAVRHPGVR